MILSALNTIPRRLRYVAGWLLWHLYVRPLRWALMPVLADVLHLGVEVDALDDRIETLENEVEAHDARIDDAEREASDAAEGLKDLTETVTQLEHDLDSLTEKVDE